METDDMLHMYAQIAAGKIAKQDSQWVTDADSSATWDKIAAGCQEIRDKGMMIEMVDELPDPPAKGK